MLEKLILATLITLSLNLFLGAGTQQPAQVATNPQLPASLPQLIHQSLD